MSKQPIRCLGTDFSLRKLTHLCTQLRLLIGPSNDQSASREKVRLSLCELQRDQGINSQTQFPPPLLPLLCPCHTPGLKRREKARLRGMPGAQWWAAEPAKQDTRSEIQGWGLAEGKNKWVRRPVCQGHQLASIPSIISWIFLVPLQKKQKTKNPMLKS